MDLSLRARLAVASLELAFNPHQKRGPDGRWIKMQTSELKRPRRPKKAKADKPDAVKASRPEVKAKPDAVKATSSVPPSRLAPNTEEPAEQMRERLTRAQRMNEAMYGPSRAKWPADERAALALLEAAVDGRLKPDSEQPQILLPDKYEEHRAAREKYNRAVITQGRMTQDRLRSQGRADADLQFYIDAAEESAQAGHDDLDVMVDMLRDRLAEHGAAALLPYPPDDSGPPLPVLPPGQRTPGGPRPPVSDRYEDRQAALDRSIRSGIVDQDVIGGGAVGDTRKVVMADGTDAIYKRARADWHGWSPQEQTDAEELGALVAAAVGVRAPAIQRADDTNLYMEVMSGHTAAARGMGGQAPQVITDSPQGMRMGLLDVLLNNTDRHSGNWMVDPDNQIAAIDHGMAFRNDDIERSQASRSPFTGPFLDYDGYADSNPLTQRDVAQIRGDLERIRPRFEELDRDAWFDQVTQRLDRLAARASGYRPLLEDAPTMFARRAAAAMSALKGGKL